MTLPLMNTSPRLSLIMLFLLFGCMLAQTFPMRTVPLEIQGFFYGYDSCQSINPQFLSNQGVVLNAQEVINVRQCTNMWVPNPAPPSSWTSGPKTGCVAGLQQPATWQDCQGAAAATGVKYWGGSGHSSGSDPKGCIYRTGDNDIYFNTHSTGSTNGNGCNTVCVQPAVMQIARGMNANAMAMLCSPTNPGNWGYNDVDTAPLSLSYPMVSGADVDNFKITLNDGSSDNPVCVTMAPANEDNEMKTMLVFGEDFGDGRDYMRFPVKFEITGDVFFNVNGKVVNGKGLSFDALDDQHELMKYTSTLRMMEAKVVEFHSRGDSAENDCVTAGFSSTTNVVKVRLSGGGTLNGLLGIAANQNTAFMLRDANQNSLTTGYLGIAGLNADADNNFDLCLDDSFNLNALEDVLLRCQGVDILVPPKGPDFPCQQHSIKVDKSRASTDYINSCKCDFDHFSDAVCDPESRLPVGHPARGKNYCQVFEESSTCSDIFNSQGKTMSYAACNFRKPEWNDEMTMCFGLSQDTGAPTAEICRVNCEEDDACEVYQFFSFGACARGTSTSCSGPLKVTAGGRKAPPSQNSMVANTLAWTLGPKTGCESGYQQPATWQECQSVAAAAGLSYWGGSGHSSGSDPKGCIYRTGDNDIYFNTHSTGSTNRNDRNTVCVPASGRRSLSVAETLASRLLSL